MNNYQGKVVSAKYSPYYTERWGDSDRNLLGYSLHILIYSCNGKRLDKVMCLELPVYAVDCKVVKDKIRALSLTSPIYNHKVNGNYVPIWDGELKIEPYLNIGIKSESELTLKFKNDKDYMMGDGITHHCVLKKPLLTGTWLDERETAIKPVAIKPIAINEIINSDGASVKRELPKLLPLPLAN